MLILPKLAQLDPPAKLHLEVRRVDSLLFSKVQ